MKCMQRRFRLLAPITLMAGLLFSASFASAQEIKDHLGDYEVFLSNNSSDHNSARILIMRSGKVGPFRTFGLAFVTNSGPKAGDGLVCEHATLLLDRSVITCTKTFRNPSNLVIGEETLTVGVTGSPYCEALRDTLPSGDKDKIVDTSDSNCDESGEKCICYDLKTRGSTEFGPPSAGSGSGRR